MGVEADLGTIVVGLGVGACVSGRHANNTMKLLNKIIFLISSFSGSLKYFPTAFG